MQLRNKRVTAVNELPILKITEIEADPHAVLGRHRQNYALVMHEAGGYMVLRHSDVTRLSNDPRLRATETAIPKAREVIIGPLYDIFDRGMLTANDAVHLRRRLPLSRAIAQQMIGEWRGHVRRIAEDLIRGFYADGQAEFVSQYASEIPVLALAALLGIPQDDIPAFKRHVKNIGTFFDPEATNDSALECAVSAGELRDYLASILSAQGDTKQHFLNAFRNAAQDAGLSVHEEVFQIIQMIIGGTESVRAGIVAQTMLLLLHRAQWKAVCNDLRLVPMAVTEAMRYEPGIAGLVRVATDDISINETTIPAGQLVILSTMSAMRDERIYQHADVFDIYRTDTSPEHLVFGSGPHRCVAENLAKAELEESLAVLATLLPSLRLEEVPKFSGHVFTRKASSMCVSWSI